MDGNKRVGVMAEELFLLVNGQSLEATDASLERLTLTIARGEVEAEEVAIWIRQRTRSLTSR